MTLFDQLIIWDKQTLLTINSYHQPWMDRFMWLVSESLLWLPLALAFVLMLLRNKGGKALFIMAALALLILVTDQVSSSIIKPLVERLRPSHDPEFGDWVNLVNGYKGGRFGFISSHAANVFAFAGFSLLLVRNLPYTVLILLWAGLVAFSRIYLGVHYPLDVLCGGLFGFLAGWGVYALYAAFFERQLHASRSRSMRSDRKTTNGDFKKADVGLFIAAVMLVLVTALIAAFKLAW